MYYVNREQIDDRLNYLPFLSRTAERLVEKWKTEAEEPIMQAALERVVHLALETVTDIGSLLIDGFIMRDASSYEDIVAILKDEQVVDADQAEFCIRLVRQRRPLVQDYMNIQHGELLELAEQLPRRLAAFDEGVRAFMAKEMG
jgi:uncharacterized protein YutE (UPF0331/DUF86 family)